jgi:futalosine hydrolase
MKQLLIISATPFEVAGVQAYLDACGKPDEMGWYSCGHWKIRMVCTGIGLVATTYNLTRMVMQERPDFVLQLGIAGVLEPSIPLGTTVWVKDDLIADLGARDQEGNLLNLLAMGLSDSSAVLLKSNPIQELIPQIDRLPKALGLSVNQITGNPDDATVHIQQMVYDCHIESMEGAAMHYVCNELDIANLQIRSISNYIEPRDKSHWQMKDAIDNLNGFAISLLENIS